MAAPTMRARKTGLCAATGRPVKVNDVIFKSHFGWALFDSEAFAAVRAMVAAGTERVDRTIAFDIDGTVTTPRRGTYAHDLALIRAGHLDQDMDREDSAF